MHDPVSTWFDPFVVAKSILPNWSIRLKFKQQIIVQLYLTPHPLHLTFLTKNHVILLFSISFQNSVKTGVNMMMMMMMNDEWWMMNDEWWCMIMMTMMWWLMAVSFQSCVCASIRWWRRTTTKISKIFRFCGSTPNHSNYWNSSKRGLSLVLWLPLIILF